MSFIQILPEKFLAVDQKDNMIIFLRDLPIRFHAKKYTLLEWGEVMQIEIRVEDVEKLGGKF